MGDVVPIRAPLTREDIIGKPTTGATHIDVARGESAWFYGVEATPRLTVHDWSKRGVGCKRTFMVDGTAVRDLDVALAVINGTMTLEEALPQPEPPPNPQKFSIDAQIEEVRYEIAQRKTVYERISSREPKRRSELEHHLKRMEAVLRTLEWVRDNRAELIGKPLGEKQERCPDSSSAADGASSS